MGVFSEWEAVQRRLEYLETAMLKAHKRTQKLEKRLAASVTQLACRRKNSQPSAAKTRSASPRPGRMRQMPSALTSSNCKVW